MSAILKDPLPEIRPMLESDLGGILAIECEAYTHPWSAPIFQDCLRVGYCCRVMLGDSGIIAYGVMSVGAGECHILNLCVRPDMQNNGHGAALLDHLLDTARKCNADMAFLEVRPSNRHAIQLYRRSGFDEVGMRRNYYPHYIGREDALIMARSLV